MTPVQYLENQLQIACEHVKQLQAQRDGLLQEAAAEELMQKITPVAGEIRQVSQCKSCGTFIGYRFIPYGLGAGAVYNACHCHCADRNNKETLLLEQDP